MSGYFLRRFLAIIPTFFGITVVAFIILNLAPGGPVEQMIRQIRFGSAGKGGGSVAGKAAATARDTGVNQDIIEALKRQYGFDKPVILNLRVEDRRIGGIDALAEVIFSIDDSMSSPAMKRLERRGTAVFPYLVPALLASGGSDESLVRLVTDNGLAGVRKRKSRLFAVPDRYYPLEKCSPQVRTGLISAIDLMNLALDSPPSQCVSLLRSARVMLALAESQPDTLDWNWRNPITEPFLEFIGRYAGKKAVESKAALEKWWRENAHRFTGEYAMRVALQAASGNPDARRDILKLGTFALPALMHALEKTDDSGLERLAAIISTISNHSFRYDPDHPEKTREEIHVWWQENRLIYTEISTWERLIKAVTYTRYGIWLKNILTLDFGQSYTYDQPVIDVILSKMPVSIQFGVVSFFATYLICIPLGIWKAVRDGSAFDYTTSIMLFLMWSIPGFMLAVLLIVFFGGGSFFSLIPIGGLFSDNYFELSFWQKILDRIHHFIAPLICYMISEFTTLTLLMKNSIIEEISKDYCRTALAKGLDKRTVYLKHALRNALIPIATGIGGFLGIFFAGSMLLEMIFNLDGMGLLGYTSVLSRDFNVIMGDLVIISIITLLGNIISDFIYTVVDPRIDFQ